MFCTKCGTEAGDGIFCPNCGNRIMSAPVTPVEIPVTELETIVTPETSEASIVTPEASIEISEAPIVTPAAPAAPAENLSSFGIEAPIKKKKKWPKVVGVLSAVIIILGVSGYFAYPMISEWLSPKAAVVSALKNTTSKIGNQLSGAVETADFTSLETPQEFSVSFQLDKLDIDRSNLLSSFSERNVTMTIQSSASDSVVAGTISIGASSTSAVSIEFYMDATNIKFKIPTLSTQTFSISMSSLTSGSDISYNDVYGMLGSLSSADIQEYVDQYSSQVSAVVGDVIKGLDTMIDSAEYSKVGTDTYKSENGDIKVSVYDIVIDEKVIKAGATAIVNNIFNDKELTELTSLLTISSRKTKKEIISEIQNTDLGTVDIPFTVYINDNKEIVKASVDLTETVGSEATATISVEFIGKESIYDYVIVNMIADGDTMKVTCTNEAGKFYFDIDIVPDESTYKDQFLSCGIQGTIKKSGSDMSVTFDKMFATGNLKGKTFDIALSGKTSTKSISSITSKSSNFAQSVDVNYMTSAQKKSVLTEVSNNITKLKGKLSDEIVAGIKTDVDTALSKLK